MGPSPAPWYFFLNIYGRINIIRIVHHKNQFITSSFFAMPKFNRLAGKTAFLLTALCSMTNASAAINIADIISALDNVECYSAKAVFSVTMPQLNDDVVYSLTLNQQRAAEPDTLLPCRYLIDWAMTSREPEVKGFSAYYDGNHFRYSGERLQEYHASADAVPFTMHGRNGQPTGVHRTAQFANLIPATLADELRFMQQNPDYTLSLRPDTLISGIQCVAIEAVMKLNGVTAMEATYTFDPETLMPTGALMENNPGSISEQSVTVSYSDTRLSNSCPDINEASLMRSYPDVFGNFRQSNFRIENLPGSRLPGFALQTTTGERYLRRTADELAAPTVVALLDASHGFTPDIVNDLRNALDALPYNAELIMAFMDKHVDAVEGAVPELRPGEHLLIGARPLARDCGAADMPAFILCDATGVVKNVLLGYNKDLATDVIQKMVLIPASGPSATGDTGTPETNNNTIATSMETVNFKETPCHTYGTLPTVGSKAPDFSLTGVDLSAIKNEDFKGQTVVLNIFPSLDTDVCARSVRRFNQEASTLENTKVLCVSEDLPFAMARFCTTNGLENVISASAFRSPAFGEKYGVMLVDGPLAGLLTRAVVIIGPDGTVKYRELVPEITNEPDYDAALRVLKGSY